MPITEQTIETHLSLNWVSKKIHAVPWKRMPFIYSFGYHDHRSLAFIKASNVGYGPMTICSRAVERHIYMHVSSDIFKHENAFSQIQLQFPFVTHIEIYDYEPKTSRSTIFCIKDFVAIIRNGKEAARLLLCLCAADADAHRLIGASETTELSYDSVAYMLHLYRNDPRISTSLALRELREFTHG